MSFTLATSAARLRKRVKGAQGPVAVHLAQIKSSRAWGNMGRLRWVAYTGK